MRTTVPLNQPPLFQNFDSRYIFTRSPTRMGSDDFCMKVSVAKSIPEAINSGFQEDDISFDYLRPYDSEDEMNNNIMYALDYICYFISGEKGLGNGISTRR